jgi:segregation and condensation protein B
VVERHARQDGRGLMLEEVGGGLRLVTRPDLHGWLRRFYEAAGATKLSMAALETLAIVAYRQPVTAPEVEALRGVSPAGVLKTLLERRLIRITGRKPVVGKPFLYATTREFLMHFGLRDLEELPPLEEFEETFGEGGVPVEVGGAAATADREERILRQAAELEEAAAEESAEPLELEPR